MDWESYPGCMMDVGGEKIPTIKCLEVVFSNVLSLVISLAVLALFIMLIVGGFKFLTSGGDHKATASARQTLTYAVAGLVLMILAFIIFRIIEYFTGVPITIFTIPTK